MTTAEINIWIRTRAKEARVVLQAVKRDLEKLSAAGANAGGVMDALSGASLGFARNMKGANAQAALLAKSLSLINKSGAPAAKHMMNVGVAAELLPPAFRNATIASQGFNTSLQKMSINARAATGPLTQLSVAAKSLSSLNTIGTRGVKNIMDIGIAAELAGPAMTQASVAAYRLNTAMGALTVSTNAAAAALRAFNIAATQAGAAAGRSAKGTQAAAAASTAAAGAMGAASTAAAAAAASTASVGNAGRQAAGNVGNLGGALGGAASNARHLDNDLWKASDKMRKIGSQAQWTGRQLSVMFTAPTLLAVGLGTAWALEYEKAFTRMKKVYNGDVADMGGEGPDFAGSKFDRFFTALSNKLGQSREEIADVAADFAQAGLVGAQLAKATELAGEFSILGDQDLKQSTTDLISVMAQYKVSVDDMREGVAHLNAISNSTPVSMANLTTGFARTASVAREAGVDMRQLGAFLAAITPAAGTAAVTANGLKSIFTRLMVPTKDAAEMLSYVGITVSDPDWISKNAVDRLAELSTKFEGLSQQQKFDLAKPFAGLYQINKFVALMDDMAHAQGNYRTALEATTSAEQSFATYQRELSTFLNSNPQKLKQAGTIIKNSLADAIIPLVPHIVYLAQGFAKLMRSFAELSPATQKFIVFAALALATIGPLAMLIGSFGILFGVLGKSVYWVARGFLFLAKPLTKLLPSFGYLKLMVQGAWLALKNAAGMLAHIFRVAASGGSINFVGGFFGRMIVGAVSWAGRMWPIITGFFAKIAPFIARVVGPSVARAMGAVAVGLTGPIGWAIAGILTLISLFPEQTWNLVKSVGGYLAAPFIQGGKLIGGVLSSIGEVIGSGLSGIWGIIRGVLMDGDVPILAKPFIIAVKLTGAALSALPKIVVAVFRGVVKVIQAAAKAVYEAFSYINPFAHHSPSLVENVTGGMAIVKDEFSAMADAVTADTRRAYAAISTFGNATAGLKVRAADFEREDRKANVMSADPSGAAWAAYEGLEREAALLKRRMEEVNGVIERQELVVERAQEAVDAHEKSIAAMEKGVERADKAIKGMNKTLDSLKAAAESVENALQKAQEQLDYYSNAPIQGMRAMSDAIFENELAQKKLRLEIMKLEEAGQSVDDLADRFSNLQGEIEKLSGEREGLRQKGAGSDILGVYDKMIADLEAQQGATASDALSPIAEAQKELERLQKEGEKLDLENALKFDPLTHQIERLTDTTRELSFEEIVSGISVNKAAVDGLTLAYDSANRAVEGQEAAIEVAEAAREAMQDSIDLEKEKLEQLNDVLDAEKDKLDVAKQAYQDLEDALSAVEAEMDSITTAAQSVNSALEEMSRKAKEAKEALGKEGDYDWDAMAEGDFEVPGGTLGQFEDDTDIDAMTKRLTDEVADMFSKIDVGAAIKGWLGRMGTAIGDWFLGLPGKVYGWLEGVGTSINNKISEWAGSVGSWFSGLGTAIGDWFSRMWDDHIWPFLSQLPGKIGTFFEELPGQLVETGAYLGGYIAGLITRAFQAALDFGTKIYDYFAGGSFEEDVRGVGDALHAWWFDSVWHPFMDFVFRAIPDFGRRIKAYFTEGGFGEDVAGVLDALHRWWFDSVWHPLVDFVTRAIPDFGRRIKAYFTEGGFEEDIRGVWDAMLGFGGNIIDGLWQGIQDRLAGARQWLQEHLVDPIKNGFKDAMGINSPSTVFAEFGLNLIQGLWEGIKGAGGWLKEKLLDWVEEHVPGPVKKLLRINSPSRVFMGFGQNIAEGLAIGIVNGATGVDSAAAELAQAATAAANTAPANPLVNPLAGTEAAYAASTTNIATSTTATLAAMYSTMGLQDTAYTSIAAAGYAAHAATTGAQFSSMSTTTQATMAAMGSGLIGTANDTTRGLTDSFRAGSDAVGLATKTMTDVATDNFQSLASNLYSIMTDQIVPVFNSFGPLLETVTGWFGDSVGNIGTIWGGIREPVAVPARFVINDVYNDGLRGAWNSFNSFLGLEALPEHIARFRDGGAIHGAGDGRSDSILARVANNEHVVTAKEVRGAGGHAAVAAQRRAWAAGLPAFAKGGPVDLNAAPWGGGGGEANLQPAAILARRNIKKYWPQIQTIGGYRAQDAYPDHPSGLALDVMTGDPMGTEINDWLHREKDALALNYTIWKQWYKPAGGVGNLMEDRGSITQNHMDHVHALFNANGVAGISAGGVGTAPMDQVVRDEINRRMDAVRDRAPMLAGGIGNWIPKSIEKGRNNLLDFMVPRAAEMSRAVSGSGMIGSAESWRGMAIEAMKRQGFAWQNEEQVNAMLRQIMSESSGNPAAIQQVIDINSGGNEAGGLLQMTPGTYAAHRDPALVDNRFDAWSNMNAALRYYRSRYGEDLTTTWGRGHGYDQGGILEPTPGGFGTYYNHSGAPEKVLTDPQWNGIYAAAKNAQSVYTVQEGVIGALEDVYGVNPARKQADESAKALAGVNEEWTPALYDAAAKQTAAVKDVADSSKATQTGVEKFVEVGNAINGAVQDLSAVMLAVGSAVEQYSASGELTFGMIAPILTALGGLIEKLPDVEPTYVKWAGTTQVETPAMKQEKFYNDISNMSKGVYTLVKDVTPLLLKHTAAIGTSIESWMVTSMPMITAAIAMFPVNPIGAALLAIPAILTGIFTILPQIIQAIVEIVPAMIKALIELVTRFMPDSVYAYESLEAAEKAAQQNREAILQGASAPYFEVPVVQQQNTNSPVTINVASVTVEAKDSDSADKFVSNLLTLAGN